VALVHGLDVAMRNERHLAELDHAEVVVHHVEMEALQVRNIAADVEGHDLSPAFIDQLGTARHPRNEEATVRGTIAFPNKGLARLYVANAHGQILDGSPFLGGEIKDALDLANECARCRHDRLLLRPGERTPLSAIDARVSWPMIYLY
jgi:hypothetical protein